MQQVSLAVHKDVIAVNSTVKAGNLNNSLDLSTSVSTQAIHRSFIAQLNSYSNYLHCSTSARVEITKPYKVTPIPIILGKMNLIKILGNHNNSLYCYF